MPFSQGQLQEATQAAERLHDALRALLAALPGAARSASGLAKFAGVERTICQRLLGAFSTGRMDAAALTRIPGSKGLAAIASALQAECGKRGSAVAVPERELAMFEAACRQVEEVYRKGGGNKRVFGERMLLTRREPELTGTGIRGTSDDTRDSPTPRRQLFEIGRELLGRHSAVTVQIFIYAPSKVHPERIDVLRVRGQTGVRTRQGAVAWVTGVIEEDPRDGASPTFVALDGRRVPARGESLLLPEFCSDPLPSIDTILKPGFMEMVINAPPRSGPAGFDMMMADQSPMMMLHPRQQDPRAGHEVITFVDVPTEAIVFEVYWHRDLARLFIPEADVHFANQTMFILPDQRWMTRLDEKVRMEVLSSGRSAPASAVYPRHAELMATAFGRRGWDREQFVGYRIEERLPLWRMGYRMFFDYVGGE
jgi:hypothetical protein